MPVYMIRAGEHGPVKIGHSHDPEIRLGQLQISHWETLRIIRLFEGGEAEENALHARFSDLYIRGEWHHFTRQMLGDVGLTAIELEAEKPLPVRAFPTPRPSEVTVHHEELLSEVEDFLSTRTMAETTFGHRAVNDGKFVGRLRIGKNMTLATIDRVRAFIREQQAAAVQPQAGEVA